MATGYIYIYMSIYIYIYSCIYIVKFHGSWVLSLEKKEKERF